MNTVITSVYIPKVGKEYTAEFIANIFDKNGIAKVSKVILEPYKSLSFQAEKYNRAYIEIYYWHDREATFNFIKSLRSANRESRLVHSLDNWWTVEINKFPHKLSTICDKHRIVTVFRDYFENVYEDDNLNTAVISIDSISIDYEKTCQLKAILYGYKNADEMEEAEKFDVYLHEAIEEINRWNESDKSETNWILNNESFNISV
jgi:hypothetical protein